MIQIQKLPEVDIMGKKYMICYENNDVDFSKINEIADKIAEVASDKAKSEIIRASTKEFTDLVLYEGAFEEIFKPFGKTVGVASYVEFMNDLNTEITRLYGEQNEHFAKITDEIKKAKSRSQNKK